MNILSNERGQSSVMIALSLVLLLAFVALVVDGGNIYAQRRQLQNAIDAASFAGTERLSRPDPTTNTRATNQQVMDAVKGFAMKNGVDPTRVSARYIINDNTNNTIIDCHLITYYGGGSTQAPTRITLQGCPSNNGVSGSVVGVQADASKEFSSFFAGVIGIKTIQVASANPGVYSYGAPPPVQPPAVATPPLTSNGTCCGEGLFPVTMDVATFSDENGDGIRDVHYEQNDPTYVYQIWDKGDKKAPGNWGYLNWAPPYNGVDQPMLVANMLGALNGENRSGRINVGDWVNATTGAKMSTFKSAWIAALNHYIVLPLYDISQLNGSNTQFRVAAFARFRVTGVCVNQNDLTGYCPISLANSSDSYISGKFNSWVYSLCEGSCPNYGITTSKSRPPMSSQRALIGVVKINQLTPAGAVAHTQAPIEIVHVLDVSGSMGNNFGSQSKLTVAKNALTSFNSHIQSGGNDKVGLVTFPTTTNGVSYRYSCTSSSNTTTYYYGQERVTPTNNVASVNTVINGLSANGGTPLAGGLFTAQGMILNPNYHTVGSLPVLIVASDGLANIRLNGAWTGFSGNTYSDIDCNRPAVQDAVDQANLFKSDGDGDGKPNGVIYSIAIGNDFDSALLKSIASAPSNNHFFTATDATSMQNIYTQIATEVTSQSCLINSAEAFAPYATITIRNQSTGAVLNATTTSTGYYAFNNIASGVWEITQVSVTVNGYTYNILTDGIGGPALSSNLTVDVGTGQGTYEKSIFLKTNGVTCN